MAARWIHSWRDEHRQHVGGGRDHRLRPLRVHGIHTSRGKFIPPSIKMGRYAYGNQPSIAQWNLARLAETLLPLLGDSEDAAMTEAQAALDGFAPLFQTAYTNGSANEARAERGTRRAISRWRRMFVAAHGGGAVADFTLTFRKLADLAEGRRGTARRSSPSRSNSSMPGRSSWKQRVADGAGDTGGTRPKAMRGGQPIFHPAQPSWSNTRLPPQPRRVTSRSSKRWCRFFQAALRRAAGTLALRRTSPEPDPDRAADLLRHLTVGAAPASSIALIVFEPDGAGERRHSVMIAVVSNAAVERSPVRRRCR